MNEAENSNSPDRFESSDSQNDSAQAGAIVSAIVVQPDGEGWETVNFPNALSVDQIPHAEELEQANARILQLEHQCKAAIDHAQTIAQQHKVAVDCIRELEQRNGELTLQVSRLEDALEQARKSVRLERRRWKTQILSQIVQTEEKLQAQAAIVAQKDQGLSDAQHAITKLFHELEQSHQTAQKQQILVETLTGQLESRQEQVAQLERECALTQQRYDEQIQTVRQAENSCRDLRSRLHRQQRYTLQFKAALEKCLDVPAPQSQIEISEVSEKSDDAPIQLFAPKARPVQPWSAQPEFLVIDPDPYSATTPPTVWEVEPEPTVLESISELSLEASAPDEQSLVTLDTWTSDGVELSEIALPQPPTHPAPVSYTIKPVEETDTPEEPPHHWNIELFNPQTGAPSDQTDLAPTHSETDLEQRLSAALQTFESDAEAALGKSFWEEPADDRTTSEISDATTPEIAETEIAETEIALLERKVDGESVGETLVTPFEQVILDHFAPISDSSPFITLQPAEPVSEQTEKISAAPFQSNGPSPVVYPLRSTKKRQSLAAVELPSFPRRGK
jgi:hypothetical protein